MINTLLWISCELSDLGTIITGKTPNTKEPDNFNGNIPFIKPSDLDKGGYIVTTNETLSKKGAASVPTLPANAIAVTCIGNLGKIGITTQLSATNQQINSLIPNKKINPKYIYYYLNTMKGWLEQEASSTTVTIINKNRFSKLPVIIPPLAEQQEIVSRLDDLLAQVDTIKARLDAIPAILKRFRQSVLVAATNGNLTKDWRKNLELNWQWVKLGNISEIKGGITKDSKKQKENFEELPYLRVANVQRLYLDLSEIKTIRIPPNKVNDLLLIKNDILFNEGGDLDKLGRGWVWEEQIERCSFQNHVYRARLFNQANSSKYISYWANTEGFEYFLRNGKQTTNLASINRKILAELPINLPPLEEQAEIVRRVEELFALAEQIEQQVQTAQSRVNHLTQAILAKAFKGELTADWRAQHPDLISGDNSAASLLAKIQAEHAAVKTKATKPKKAQQLDML